MGYLASYNTSSFSGSLDRGNINIAISSSIVSGSTGTIRFGDTPPPPSGGMVIVSDSNVQLGIASASATPQFWIINNLADTASVLNTINALPERVNQTRFTTTSSAYLYLVSSSKYFPILGTEPLNTIVTDGLTMYLDAGQLVSYPTTASTWYDISGNNISGSLVNGPTFNINGAIVFDGVDDSSTINNVPVSYLSSSTIDVTFKVGSYYGTGFFALAGYNFNGGNYSQGTTGIIYVNQSGTVFGSLITTSQVYRAVTSTSTVPINRYYTATLYKDTINGILKLYINGKLESSNTFDPATYAQWPTAGTYIGNNNFIIGSYASNNWGVGPYLNGSVSSTKLYGKLLSDSEILQNYYQAPIVTNGLIFSVDANNLVSYESSSVRAYSLSLSGSRTTPVSCSLTNGLAFYTNNGGYFDFDGTDDQLLIENVPAQSTGIHLGNGTIPWMVNAWIRTSVAGNNTIGTNPVLSNRASGPVYSNMGIGSGGVMKYAHYSGSWIVETGSIAVNDNRWHMLSWVNLNNNTLNMYVDGVFDKNVSSSIVGGGNINPVDIIGASWSSYLNGDIAFLSINISSSLYNIQNVQQNFNAQRQRFGL